MKVALALLSTPVLAAQSEDIRNWSVAGQVTAVWQYHPEFKSPYRGSNSLDPASRGDETIDATLYVGARPWSNAEVWFNPELDQGFGLSNTLGVAGFPSGEAYKVGSSTPYFRLHRLFFRQTFNLGGSLQPIDGAINQLRGMRSADNLVLTMGKISVADIFDTNRYAHDPRSDFLNWAVIDSGAYDYAADAWGFTYGVAAEWTQSWWTLRLGVFDLSRHPNATSLETRFGQFEITGEAEGRFALWDQPGKLKLLGFVNRGRMGSYLDAVRLAQQTRNPPDTAAVREYGSEPGIALNMEQQITQDLGVFARISINNGSTEAFEFTEINKSIAVGFSLNGASWNRSQDTVGLAAVSNGLSDAARSYFGAGGIGILIGDGRLPSYGTENIVETYYSMRLAQQLSLSLDYQWIGRPAYNRERGPVSVFGMRFHAEAE
jgi:high affinity Mn2+ porin